MNLGYLQQHKKEKENMEYNGMKRSEKDEYINDDYIAFSNMKEEPENTMLEKATEIVNGSREEDYGSAFDNMKHIADIFNSITGRDLTPEEVVLLNVSQKLSREIYKHKEDNLVDLIGYIEVLNKVINDKKNNK